MSDAGAVFLDRDGTLIVEKEYLSDPDEVELERGVIGGLTLLQSVGRSLVVVTSQSGIGRGYFSLEAALAVNERIDAILREHGVILSAWYLCPHAPEERCRCRKPGRALADRAAADLGIRLEDSFVIGDKRSDVEFAFAIGATGILITTGHGRSDAAWAVGKSCLVFDNFLDAARYIVGAQDSGPNAQVRQSA
jgi:histidinol-phosphate phosphatase family protein